MQEIIDKVKELVRSRMGQDHLDKMTGIIDDKVKYLSGKYEEDVIILAELLSDLDKENIFDYLSEHEVSLAKVQEIFRYIDEMIE